MQSWVVGRHARRRLARGESLRGALHVRRFGAGIVGTLTSVMARTWLLALSARGGEAGLLRHDLNSSFQST